MSIVGSTGILSLLSFSFVQRRSDRIQVQLLSFGEGRVSASVAEDSFRLGVLEPVRVSFLDESLLVGSEATNHLSVDVGSIGRSSYPFKEGPHVCRELEDGRVLCLDVTKKMTEDPFGWLCRFLLVSLTDSAVPRLFSVSIGISSATAARWKLVDLERRIDTGEMERAWTPVTADEVSDPFTGFAVFVVRL